MDLQNSVAIIGGGIGGLTVGALLASRGYQVSVFDKNAIIGGYCQGFRRRENLIHPAVLRVGSHTCAKSVNNYLEQAGAEPVQWLKYHETYEFGNEIKIRQGAEYLRADLIHFFPDEKEHIEDFFSSISALYDIMNKVFMNNMSTRGLTMDEMNMYIPSLKLSAFDFVEKFFHGNTVLRDVILSMLELDPKSVALAIPMTYFEIKGDDAYYVPTGGAFEIVKHLCGVIEKHGGKIYRRKTVTSVRVENSRCVSVLCGEEDYPCGMVISAMDINKTYQQLVGAEKIDDKKHMLVRLKSKWRISKSCLSVWLGLDVPLEELNIPYGSIVYYQSEKNIFQVRQQMSTTGETLPEDFWMQIFSVFSRDPLSTAAGNSQICLGLLLPYDFENHWGGDEYSETKNQIVRQVVECFERKYPKVKGHITYIEAATPLTYEKETLNTNGAYLGFEKYENYVYDRGRHQNQGLLSNLFFASHWVSVIGGVNGVMQEALKTANLVMEKFPLPDYNQRQFSVYE